jgi:hypothetical protein
MQDESKVDDYLDELRVLILKSKTNLTFADRKRFRIVCKELKALGYTLTL